jgi:hypothetical protein
MKKIKLHKNVVEELLKIKKDYKVTLEGNILKLLDAEDDLVFKEYIETAIKEDKSKQRARLDITKQIQSQNKELLEAQIENETLLIELQAALESAEEAKETALSDLDLLQKKSQFQLVQTIVRIALGIVIGVGVLTTILYIVSLFMEKDTQLIGNTWSNMFGILLTNAFSIIGTIMGVKYASKSTDSE